MDPDELAAAVEQRRADAARPITVGVSGFCGAGKSTLTRSLVGRVTGAVRIRGDDFLDPDRSHRRSTDWEGVDRERLVTEVLLPFRGGRAGSFRRFDWSAGRLGEPEPIPTARILVVDLIGLFHPEALQFIDLAVWCDVDLATAARRGMARDASLGRRHDDLWRDVWMPNDADFTARFAPRVAADVVVPTA